VSCHPVAVGLPCSPVWSVLRGQIASLSGTFSWTPCMSFKPELCFPEADQRICIKRLHDSTPPVTGCLDRLMKAPCSLTLFAFSAVLFTGCIIFPHGEVVAPPAHGRVVDADTLEPVRDAKVVRWIARVDREKQTFTDEQGCFAFAQDKDLAWLLPVEYINEIRYRIDAAGHLPFETNLHGGQVHDLDLILLLREGGEMKAGGSP